MGFETRVGLLRVLHVIAGPTFALLATLLAPYRKRLALAWLAGFLLLTGTAVWSLPPAVVEAGPSFALTAAMVSGGPFAFALAAALAIALLLRWKAPRLPFLLRSLAALGGYIGGFLAGQLVLPTVRLYAMLHTVSTG
jgi:hypothetical protein